MKRYDLLTRRLWNDCRGVKHDPFAHDRKSVVLHLVQTLVTRIIADGTLLHLLRRSGIVDINTTSGILCGKCCVGTWFKDPFYCAK